jgi:hypothetical protein
MDPTLNDSKFSLSYSACQIQFWLPLLTERHPVDRIELLFVRLCCRSSEMHLTSWSPPLQGHLSLAVSLQPDLSLGAHKRHETSGPKHRSACPIKTLDFSMAAYYWFVLTVSANSVLHFNSRKNRLRFAFATMSPINGLVALFALFEIMRYTRYVGVGGRIADFSYLTQFRKPVFSSCSHASHLLLHTHRQISSQLLCWLRVFGYRQRFWTAAAGCSPMSHLRAGFASSTMETRTSFAYVSTPHMGQESG